MLYNRDNREYLVKAFPMVVRYDADRVHLSCYFPMPFFRSARIELIAAPARADRRHVHWSVRYAPYRDPANHVAYFHATYRDHPSPEPGKDLVLLDTREAEGGGDWSGQFVGTSFIFSHDAVLNTLEGDPRFFFDDSQTPQAQGTGTEEWGGGGDYWGGQNMTLPFAGHPTGARNATEAAGRRGQDRVRLPVPAGRPDALRQERPHPPGTWRRERSTEHYETVTYWYGLPAPSLIQTDELKIGDEASERAASLLFARCLRALRDHLALRMGAGHAQRATQEIYPAHDRPRPQDQNRPPSSP